MRVEIHPGRAQGIVAAPPSKSMAHRLLICAGLSRGISKISGVELNEDVAATIDCLRQMGADCQVVENTVAVRGADPHMAAPAEPLCCRESGSTLRFFIPLALLCGKPVSFTGTEKLLSRPLSVYDRLCKENACSFRQEKSALQVQGILKGGGFTVPGDISSQFITGLLFALPLTEEDSVIHLLPPVESRSYIDLTLRALDTFGIQAEWKDDYTLYIKGNQCYKAQDVTVEGDYSGAAFYGALNTLGSNISVTGLDPDSLQGDQVYAQYFESLREGMPTLNIGDCPDLGPVLFAVAAARNGGIFTGTRRLKLKESDRAAAMAQELAAFGTKVILEEDRVTVIPEAFHAPEEPLSGHNDHRIVMSLAVLLTLTGGQIRGAQAVSKSFPDFFDKLRELGIEVIGYEADE